MPSGHGGGSQAKHEIRLQLLLLAPWIGALWFAPPRLTIRSTSSEVEETGAGRSPTPRTQKLGNLVPQSNNPAESVHRLQACFLPSASVPLHRPPWR